jgi:hypothetical protein
MSSNIKLNTRKNSYDPAKYESLGIINLAMSVNVSFQPPAPKPSGLFGTSEKPVPVNKQQKLTETQNAMIESLKKSLIDHAPQGTEMLIGVKIGHSKNIGNPPDYILSMSASATAVRKINTPQPQAMPMAQPMPQPMPTQMPMAQGMPAPMPAPMSSQGQFGGKKRARKTRKHRR